LTITVLLLTAPLVAFIRTTVGCGVQLVNIVFGFTKIPGRGLLKLMPFIKSNNQFHVIVVRVAVFLLLSTNLVTCVGLFLLVKYMNTAYRLIFRILFTLILIVLSYTMLAFDLFGFIIDCLYTYDDSGISLSLSTSLWHRSYLSGSAIRLINTDSDSNSDSNNNANNDSPNLVEEKTLDPNWVIGFIDGEGWF